MLSYAAELQEESRHIVFNYRTLYKEIMVEDNIEKNIMADQEETKTVKRGGLMW